MDTINSMAVKEVKTAGTKRSIHDRATQRVSIVESPKNNSLPQKTMDELYDLLAVMRQEISTLNERVRSLEAENGELKDVLRDNKPMEAMALDLPKPGAIQYNSIAIAFRPTKARVEPASRPEPRKLIDSEMELWFKGLPTRPVRKITAIYMVGPRADKRAENIEGHSGPKARGIRDYKLMLKKCFQLDMEKFLSIDFIGRTVMEIQVYEDYVSVLKSKVAMKTRSWKDPFSFVEVDPLDESLPWTRPWKPPRSTLLDWPVGSSLL